MAKIRVYELAKQLDKSSKDILDRLTGLGVKVKNHMSVVDQKFVNELIKSYNEDQAKSAGRSGEKRGEREGTSGTGLGRKSGESNLGDRFSRNNENNKLGRERARGQELRDDAMKRSGVKSAGRSASPSRDFDKPTVDGKKVIFFEKTTYFDGRSPSGGLKATHTSIISDPKKSAGESRKKADDARAKATDEAMAKTGPKAADLTKSSTRERTKAEITEDKRRESREAGDTVKSKAAPPGKAPVGAKQDEARRAKPLSDSGKEDAEKSVSAKAEAAEVDTRKDASAKGRQVELRDRERPGDIVGVDQHEESGRAGGRRPEERRSVKTHDISSKPAKSEEGPRAASIGSDSAGRAFSKPVTEEDDKKKKKRSKDRNEDYSGEGDRKARASKRLRYRDDFEDDESEGMMRVPKRSGKGRKDKAECGEKASLEKSGRRRDKVVKERKVQLPEEISIKNLAAKIDLTPANLIKKFLSMGTMVTINQEIDFDTAAIVLDELGIEAERISESEEKRMMIEDIEDPPETLRPRPPVVTILGHVDHGKTSLLDAIRETNVTASEAGGITQHIGAYQVELNGRKITFLDTPGHEAFTAMRARGAQVTDLAVLVVAADDGVMPQTVEAINHAKAAGVPILVAVNKIDKPSARPERVKQQLTEYGLVLEEWGGDTIFVEVSALRRTGIENLLEMILLIADLKELKANPDRMAKGVVIEARLDRGRGPVATVLIQKGTLRVSDTIIAGIAFGRVRAMTNHRGESIEEAGPSVPVEVVGFSEVPEAGDTLYAIEEDKDAREIAARRFERKRKEELKESQKVSLDDFYRKMQEGEIKELNIIIKADVQGSVEAVTQSLERLSNDDVRVKVIHGGVGAITEADIMLAMTSNAIVIGFNVRPDTLARKSAEREKVDLRLYRVIYDAVDDVKKALEGLLEPEFREEIIGRAEVRATFKVPRAGTVAGCYVVEGKINRSSQIRVIRDNIVIFEGRIESLRRFKDDVREVAEGFECGIGIERFNDVKEGDIIEAFVIEKIEKKLQ